MFRTVGDQVSLWEAVLPPELLRLPDELARVDALLDDPVFFAPFVAVLRPADRSSVDADGDLSAVDVPEVPVPAGVRVVVPGGERFDHLAAVLPDPVGRCGAASDDVDEADHPVRQRRGGRAERGACWPRPPRRRCCAPTGFARTPRWSRRTCAYPTDSGLLAKAIRRIGATGRRIQAAGGAVRTKLRDRSRAAGRRAHGIAAKLRSRAQLGRDQVKDGVQRITGELADLAEAAARDAQRLLVNARRALRRAEAKAAELAAAGVRDPAAGRRRGRLARAVNDLSALLRGHRARSPSRPGNGSPGPPRTAPAGWSACTTAMPARSPRAGSGNPSSSVTRARSSTTTTASWWITTMHAGNPADAPQLAPAIERIKARTGRAPRTVTADRGLRRSGRRPGIDRARCPHCRHTAQGPARCRPPARRETPSIPPNHQMAHRMRRPDQHPQTRIRLGPHPPGQPRRSENLDRTRGLHPQPDQESPP